MLFISAVYQFKTRKCPFIFLRLTTQVNLRLNCRANIASFTIPSLRTTSLCTLPMAWFVVTAPIVTTPTLALISRKSAMQSSTANNSSSLRACVECSVPSLAVRAETCVVLLAPQFLPAAAPA